jgi:hypothetical protein
MAYNVTPGTGAFDYRALPDPLAQDLRDRAARIRCRDRKISRTMIAQGLDLLDAQTSLGRTYYLWLDSETDLERKEAERLVAAGRLVRKLGDDKLSLIETMTVSAIYVLAAPCTPQAVVEAVLGRLAEGYCVRRKDILAMIDAAGPGGRDEAGTAAAASRWLKEIGHGRIRDLLDDMRRYPSLLSRLDSATAVRKARKPQSLFTFLASSGGLKPCPDLRHLLDGQFRWLINNKRGMSLDRAREASVEGGYLAETPWHGGLSISTPADLLDLIDREARGEKVYPLGHNPIPLQPAADDLTESHDVDLNADWLPSVDWEFNLD